MKKYLFTTMVAAALMACNNTAETNAPVADSTATTTEQTAPATGNDEVTPEDAVNNTRAAMAASSDYTPTGNVAQDAQAMVDAQLEIAMKEVDGTLTEEEKNKVTGMLLKLGEYYTKAGKQDEFQQVLGQKLAESMKKLKMEKLGS